MNILITNIAFAGNSGTELYVKELAMELRHRGHNIEVYTFFKGPLANELDEIGINVVDSLKLLKYVPDIIHAHHNIVVAKAAAYFSVDYNCKDRYKLEAGFADEESEVIFNWYNPNRFIKRNIINPKPLNALIFSNYIDKGIIYNEIQAACNKLHINLHIIGENSNNLSFSPENVLPAYNLVFGKAKAAIEAMATGAAVIVCDFRGLAEMVTPQNMEHYRKYNFGMKLMNRPVQKDLIIAEINKYNAANIELVTDYIREKSNFYVIVSAIEAIYFNTINDFKTKKGKYIYSVFKQWSINRKNAKYLLSYYLRNNKKLFNFLRKMAGRK
jgi:hypothetical protein